jgi:small-conductance mechanosensitive channel
MEYTQLVEELKSMVSKLWGSILELLPKLILGLFVLLIGYLLARLVRSLVSRFIAYLDKVINKHLSAQQVQVNLSNSKIFISKAFFWIIIFLAITLFTEILGLPVISSWLAGLGDYLPRLLAGLVVVFFGIIFGRLASDLVKSRTFKSGIYSKTMLGRVINFTILVITIIIAINQVGIDISFLTSLTYILVGGLLFGAALAFAIGARTSVSNILASFYISRTYAEGNLIRIGEHEGRIIRISSTSVVLETESGQVIIPAKAFNEQDSMLIRRRA